jgi:hypothetical protein
MTRRRRIFAMLGILLLSLGLEGCISLYTGRYTVIDTGGAISTIGREEAKLLYTHRPEHRPNYIVHNKVWKKGDTYIVQIPITYAPARETFILHGRGWHNTPDQWRWPDMQQRKADSAGATVEYYYALMDEKQYRRLTVRLKRITREHHKPFYQVPVIPASETDLSGAELVLDSKASLKKNDLRTPQLEFWHAEKQVPDRRAWYNYPLMPLSWAAEVVDIPLTIIATPIGWVVDAIYEPSFSS